MSHVTTFLPPMSYVTSIPENVQLTVEDLISDNIFSVSTNAFLIDSVPQEGQVACHHGDAQTNKATKCDGRVGPLIFPLHNADKSWVGPPVG